MEKNCHGKPKTRESSKNSENEHQQIRGQQWAPNPQYIHPKVENQKSKISHLYIFINNKKSHITVIKENQQP